MQRIEFEVTGIVSGFQRDDKVLEEAQSRLALEAEMKGNSTGEVRIHITVIDGEEV